jgi:CheY-like chemotaxis protein/KaiC/GvpD/RAD55 family RecA-like ATPase
VLDRVIGGLAPGLPLVLAGPSGCGRTVLSLQVADAALRDENIVAMLTAEPAPLLLRQAETLGIDLRGAVASEQLLLLEIDPRAAGGVATHGGAAFVRSVLAEHPSLSLLVIDPFTALTREILDEAPLRSVVREVVAGFPHAALVLGMETGRPGLEGPIERVLAEVCGSFVTLGREADGRRTARVGKTRAGVGPAEAVEFRIGDRGAELVREIEASAPEPAPARPPALAAPTTPAPRNPPALPAAPAPRQPRRPEAPCKVLVVQDDAGLRAQLCQWLERRYQVVSAPDGLQALSLLLAEKPDCIVLELGMNRITGYEVLVALHRAAQSLPILTLANSTERSSERLAPLVLGAADVLGKPVQAFEVLHKVEMLLRLEGPPTHLMDRDDAIALFGNTEPTRALPAAAFRERLTRACDFGERFGASSTLLALSAPSADAMDRLLGVADRLLRFEDALVLVSKRRALVLLVAAERGAASAVVGRLERGLETDGSPETLRWRAWDARPPEELGDWRALFRDEEEADPAETDA